jgi:ABC-type transport system involved in multi-copper enzyme maturation permease subunit
MRLVNAEVLKLYRRTGIVLATLGLTIVPALIMLLVTGGGDTDTGGLRTFSEHFGILALLVVVAGILVGATLGTSDESSGVFRELVVTGRSRLDLFAVRVPAGLALVLVAAAAGYAIVALAGTGSAGSVSTTSDELGTIAPTAGLLLKCGAWLALVAAISFALSLGVASVVGSVGGSIAVLLALWLVVTPLIQNLDSLEWLEDALMIAGLDRLLPTMLTAGDPVERLSLPAAVAVLLAWSALPLLAGAWRTLTRDA